MCNLTCRGFISESSPYGCDSFVSWSKKNKFTFDSLHSLYVEGGFVNQLKNGYILKLTGGEPLIQQKKMLSFYKEAFEKWGFIPQIDFESNATITPLEDWWSKLNATFTVSPKLSNNGDPEDKRYKPDVLKLHKDLQSCFKFVVKNRDDINEIFNKYIEPFNIDRKRVWFMPCCGSRAEHIEIAPAVAEWAKEACVNFSPRLHLLIWDMALKV